MAEKITMVFGEVGCKADGTQYASLSERLSELELMMPSGVSVDYKLATLQWIPLSTESDKKEMVQWLKGHQQSVIDRAETQQDAQKFLGWIGELEKSLPQVKRGMQAAPVLALLPA
ncbi:MAG: hypothetical protein A3J37_05815 [Alphaproteobacteria bacterium RIFCSPHIGHO2_12_FULL_45_9]|nr:MAG: hypothetical protein A3B66_04985 [Alphaproteobacteria bacterium RIFCSPHIGHO2_02_FULL_46_13]OFW94914.1 MAG: hypothetical protein A3J37_05815 [Alphaproteobacteria bacterium RIFCSPHIGHO2_12_FULL_45_9]